MGKKLLCAVLIIVLLLVVYWLFLAKERMTDAVYLDQIVYDHPDPLLMKYSGRERDITGMSSRDYYYENTINALNLTAPQYLEGDSNYVDHTDYLDMPLEYRPAVKQTDRIPSLTKGTTSSAAPLKSASPGAMQMAVK